MIITFAWTSKQFLSGLKSVTRRDWSDRTFEQWCRAWDQGRRIHKAYDKSPRCGGQQIGTFHLSQRPYRERLIDMPKRDLIREGGLWKTKEEFIELLGGDPDKVMTVIRFWRIHERTPSQITISRGIGRWKWQAALGDESETDCWFGFGDTPANALRYLAQEIEVRGLFADWLESQEGD